MKNKKKQDEIIKSSKNNNQNQDKNTAMTTEPIFTVTEAARMGVI